MNSRTSIRTITQIAVMAAVMCILGPMSIPIGAVPISLTPFTVMLTVYLLGMRKGTISVLVYILLGMAGLPVFSGYQGGVGKVAGPTGGYIIGFIFMALVSGFFIDHFYDKIWVQVVGMLLGIAVCYTFGTIWLMVQAHMSLGAALAAGVFPFIGLDVIKMVLAILIGRLVRNALVKAGLLGEPGRRHAEEQS